MLQTHNYMQQNLKLIPNKITRERLEFIGHQSPSSNGFLIPLIWDQIRGMVKLTHLACTPTSFVASKTTT